MIEFFNLWAVLALINAWIPTQFPIIYYILDDHFWIFYIVSIFIPPYGWIIYLAITYNQLEMSKELEDGNDN